MEDWNLASYKKLAQNKGMHGRLELGQLENYILKFPNIMV
jgi:hypothetical protein